MKLTGNTVLITGGSEGIGFALAKALVADNRVIVCGRSEEKLARAKSEVPELLTHVCDITDPVQRRAMIGWLLRSHPDFDVLVNNAGSKRFTDLLSGRDLESAMTDDLAVNFTAPIMLTMELLPHLRSRPEAAIVNMTTGLVYLPKAEQAFYCAAKAALHSYSQSLRWVLGDSPVAIHEVLLTLVATNFHGGQVPTNIKAISPDEAARLALKGIRQGEREISIGKAALAPWLALFAPQRGMGIVNR